MQVLAKAYIWFSGIAVAFLASYLTGVLTAIVPAPKNLLCNLKLGFCQPPYSLTFSATDIDRIKFPENVGQSPAPDQIGMLNNKVIPDESDRSNSVSYQLDDLPEGKYNLNVLYASAVSRPVEVLANNRLVASSALAETTRGWSNNYREWSAAIPIEFTEKGKMLTIRRASVFPHLSKIQFTQAPAR